LAAMVVHGDLQFEESDLFCFFFGFFLGIGDLISKLYLMLSILARSHRSVLQCNGLVV
jgi:hypothetical protein